MPAHSSLMSTAEPLLARLHRGVSARPACLLALALLGALAIAPAGARADLVAFGSPLAVPATLDTSSNLNYSGTDIPTIIGGRAVVVHVSHDGADTVLWNGQLASGTVAAPADGQISEVRLEGCAQPAADGPPPVVEIHFQDLVPRPDGGAQIRVTSQPFSIPVCGAGGADASTVTAFYPTNLCVAHGDYVGFNDEGGFDSRAYPSGVPYQVMGSVGGSTMYSFVRNNGTNNGSVMRPGDLTNHDGFVANPGEELMMQSVLATGPDATPLCPGGSRGLSAPIIPGRIAAVRTSKRFHLSPAGVLSLPVVCYQHAGCSGQVLVDLPNAKSPRAAKPVAHLASGRFVLKGDHSSRLTLRLGKKLVKRARRRRGLPVRVTVINEVPAGPPAISSIVLSASRRR